MTEWIKCSKKFPKKEKPVYLYGKKDGKTLFGVGILTKVPEYPEKYWIYAHFKWTDRTYPTGDHQAELEEITHWAELPEPPKDESYETKWGRHYGKEPI